MTKTQKLVSLAAAFVLVITNLENVSTFFGLPAVPIRAAGLTALAVLAILALLERQPSEHVLGTSVHTISDKALRRALWCAAVIIGLCAVALLLHTYWLADRLGASRYRARVAKEHSYVSLLGTAAVRPMRDFVLPGLILHRSFRTIVDPRDSLEMLLLGDGSAHAPPKWIMGYDAFWRLTDLSAKLRGAENEKSPETVTLDAITKSNRHVVITARPGANLYQFRRYLTFRYATDQTDHIPVVITAEALTNQEALFGAIEQAFTTDSWTASRDSIEGNFESGRIVLLIDSFQNTGTNRDTDERVTLLETMAQRYPELTILVFADSRSLNSPIPNYALAELTGYTEKQQDKYAALFFGSEVKAKALRKQLVAQPRLRRLASNQLILSLMCLIFDDKSALPHETTVFYDNVIDTLMDDAGRVERKDREAVRRTAGIIAARMVEARTDTITDAELRRLLDRANGSEVAALYDAVVRSGLLARAAREQLAFVHPMVQDYLAAEEVARMETRVAFDLLERHVDDYFWQQVVAFAAARYGWPFVRQLLSVPDDIFMTRHFLVDHILRSGLLTSPPTDVIDRMVRFHKRTSASPFALQRYRSLAATIDWLFVDGDNAGTGACAIFCKGLGLPGLRVLTDSDINVRRKGARYVARVMEVGADKGRDAETGLARIVDDVRDSDLRLEMLAYAKLNAVNSALLQRELKAACENDDANRFRIYSALIERAVPEATPILREALLCDRNDENVRRSIGAYLQSDATVQKSIADAVSGKRQIDAATLKVAAYSGIRLSEELIATALRARSQGLRTATIDYIAESGRSELASVLQRHLDGDATPTDVAHIVHALADIGAPLSEKKLLVLVKHSEPAMRAVAVHALRAHGSETAKLAIRSSMRDSNSFVRSVAIGALGHLRDEQALGDLIRVIEDPAESPEMKRACLAALGHLSSESAKEKVKQYALHGQFPLSVLAAASLDPTDLDRETVAAILDRVEEGNAIALASRIGPESDHFEYMMTRFARSTRFAERLEFAMEATALDDATARELLLPLLNDSVPPVRDAAFVSLYVVARRSGITVPGVASE